MPARSIIAFLIAKLNDRTIARVYDRYIADMLYITAQGKRASDDHWWNDIEKTLLGANTPKHDENLSAAEIIARVKAAHKTR